MAKIVYTDHEESATSVTFHGVEFTHRQEVEVGDHLTDLLDMVRGNRFFRVTEQDAPRETAAGTLSRRDAKPGNRKSRNMTRDA